MATQSSGIHQRTRTKLAPSFPRERQPSEQHSFQQYYVPTPQHYANGQTEVESWRIQSSLHSAPIPPSSAEGMVRRTSRGPRTASPVRSETRVFTWDQHPQFSSQRQHFRRKSVTSNTSSSDQHTLLRSPHPSRSPSPGTPRSSLSSRTLRTPMTSEYKRIFNRKLIQSNGTNGAVNMGCIFETALVNSRRRIPYSVGAELLAIVPPENYLQKLDEKHERCLSVDVIDLYHVLTQSLCCHPSL